MQVVMRRTGDRHGARLRGMSELTVRAALPDYDPTVASQQPEHIAHLHVCVD